MKQSEVVPEQVQKEAGAIEANKKAELELQASERGMSAHNFLDKILSRKTKAVNRNNYAELY
jgi:hypothetical protein